MSNPATCFLIDDDIDDLEIFELALKSVNPSVVFVTATDGVEAVKKLAEEESFNPDFIFLDLNMPRMDGKQCLQEIRKIRRLQHIPIVIYSTSSEEKDKRETKALGADFYLEKQASITSLKNKLAVFFNR
jgi:CheY-like chemotaxis protein